MAAWVCSLYPAIFLGSLYLTWLLAWASLGHFPRASLDDPRGINSMVLVAHDTTLMLLVGIPVALFLSILLTLASVIHLSARNGDRWWLAPARLLVPLISWPSLYLLGQSNDFVLRSILIWFMD